MLDYAQSRADDMNIVRGIGFQSESSFAFAVLGQVAGPLISLIDRLPGPQARALSSALGLDDEPVADRLLVFAGFLSLLAESAEDRPTLCLVDDIQWADQGSVDALAFAARRLHAERVAMLLAARVDGAEDPTIRGLPDYPLERLGRADALKLIREHGTSLSAATENRLVEASAGNPLALVEFPRVFDERPPGAAEWSHDPLPLRAKINSAFLEQSRRLSTDARTILVVIAADLEPTVEESMAVARELGADPKGFAEAEDSGLVCRTRGRLGFRHPLIRPAVYNDASAELRLRVHRLYSEVFRSERQIESKAWHRSLSTSAPDEELAGVLQASAGWSQKRGALEASSWAWARAADFSEDSESAAWRMKTAADTARLAGDPARARALIDRAGRLHGGEDLRAKLDVLRGGLELRTGRPADAHAILSSVARRMADADPVRALRILTEAGEAASYAGDRDLIVATGAQAAELVAVVSGPARLPGLVLIGSGKVVSGEAERGRSICREAVSMADEATDASDLVWASIAAQYGGDEVRAHGLAVRAAAAARTAGQLALLPYALEFKALAELYASSFASARSSASEGVALARELRQENSIGRHLATLAWIDAVQGSEAECREHGAEALAMSEARGLGLQRAFAHWALGLLELTLGRPQEAFEWFRRLLVPAVGASHPGIVLLTVPDVVETALRTDGLEEVTPLATRFEEFAGADGPPWARALAARCRALTSGAADAERHFLQALELHNQANRPWDQARTSLLYGEHLRRMRRRVDARGPLRAASREFDRLGARPWSTRAQGELRATGENVGPRDVGSSRQLTSQEFQIVGLVRDGSSNRSVAEQLFLSPRTVEYHLSKVYAKLGISSRSALAAVDLESVGTTRGP